MSRYSPTVLPDAPDPNAAWEGLASALGSYAAARDYEHAQKEHDEDRAHMLQSQKLGDAIQQANARQAGITPGTTPHEDLDITVPDGLPASADHLPWDEQMRPHPQGLADAFRGRMNTVASPGFNGRASASPPMGGATAVRTASGSPSAVTMPGAFSIAGGGFPSPLRQQMASGDGAPNASTPSHTLHMTPSYEQLTPDYYYDRTAPGPVGSALARELGQRKTEAEIGELGARAKYLSEHGDYFEQGGYGGRGAAGAPHTLRTPTGYQQWNPATGKYEPMLDENGKPVMPVLPRPSTALPANVRGARTAASAARTDATSYDRRANSFSSSIAGELRNQLLVAEGDTADLPALRDSVSKYRAKADSARAAAASYDEQANHGSGVTPPVLRQPRTTSSDASGSGGAPRYTRQQIDAFYQDAIKRGADPAKAKARRDSLVNTAR